MSKEYMKALMVISKPPEKRYDHEINQLVPWLRSKAKLFKGIKADILADIIRNCHYVTKNRDDVVIKQGDIGDCFYITLNGKVTIYILNKDQLEGEVDDNDFSNLIQYTKDGDVDRSKLGNFVISLGGGAPFGDVALTSGDSIRTATIIADERTDLLVIDRALYNRSMKEVLAKEFQEKTTFIKNNPLFSNWPPKYRKQLAMALYKETFAYESSLTRQGDRTMDMYFILRGQVEIQIDPSLHPMQYPLIFKAARENEVDKLIKSVDKNRQSKENNRNNNQALHHHHHHHTFNGSSIKKRDVTRCTRLCHLGYNESVGDLELTMDLPTYVQTAVCRETTEVLVLENKHYERLFLRRHPRTIETMRDQIGVKLNSRLSMLHSHQELPLLHFLVKIIEGRHKAPPQNEKEDEHTVSTAEKDFLNHKGPLIDLHGPGSVFFLIKLRERTKRKVRAMRGERNDNRGLPSTAVGQFAATSQSVSALAAIATSTQSMSSPSQSEASPAYGRPRSARGLTSHARSFREIQSSKREASNLTTLSREGLQREESEYFGRDTVVVSPMSSTPQELENAELHDAKLSTLENRLRLWLEKDSPRGKVQVAPLRRLIPEEMLFQPKPGNKVFVRRRDRGRVLMASPTTDEVSQFPRESPRTTKSRSTHNSIDRSSTPIVSDEARMQAFKILLTH